MCKKCIWCLREEPEVTFLKKAHTIPRSLGGQNFNQNVCDSCNEYFGNRQYKYFSIETVLKETFNITRYKLLRASNPKRKVGEFKSVFFVLTNQKNDFSINIKDNFRFDSQFQNQLCRAFKQGLYKLYFEEINRQRNIGYEDSYNIIRSFARYDKDDLPVVYFYRSLPVILLLGNEHETPVLYLEKMSYLYSNDYFTEIEFLGHVFGFPIKEYTNLDFLDYIKNSIDLKEKTFKSYKAITRLTDIDLLLKAVDS